MKVFFKIIPNSETVSKLKHLLYNKRAPHWVFCYEKLNKDYRYFVVRFGQNLEYAGCSVWYNHPTTYGYDDIHILEELGEREITSIIENSADYDTICKILEILNVSLDYERNKNQLQGEKTPNSGHGQRSVLHGRRNIFKYSAGRHCDQAGIKEKGARTGRYKVKLSVRSAKVLGY